jgi:hypothetical protein
MRNVYSNRFKKLKIGIRFEEKDLLKHEQEYAEVYNKIHNLVEKSLESGVDHTKNPEYLELLNREDRLNSIGKYIRGGVFKKNKNIKKYFGKDMLIIGLGISSEDPCWDRKCRYNCVFGMPDVLGSRRKVRHCFLVGTKLDTKFKPFYTKKSSRTRRKEVVKLGAIKEQYLNNIERQEDDTK